jgi:hypothetical protein
MSVWRTLITPDIRIWFLHNTVPERYRYISLVANVLHRFSDYLHADSGILKKSKYRNVSLRFDNSLYGSICEGFRSSSCNLLPSLCTLNLICIVLDYIARRNEMSQGLCLHET